MSKAKYVHKIIPSFRFNDGGPEFVICGTYVEVSNAKQIWKNVTCPRCLAKKQIKKERK